MSKNPFVFDPEQNPTANWVIKIEKESILIKYRISDALHTYVSSVDDYFIMEYGNRITPIIKVYQKVKEEVMLQLGISFSDIVELHSCSIFYDDFLKIREKTKLDFKVVKIER